MIKNLEIFKNKLIRSIKKSDRVFIVPHIFPDCDAIASAFCFYKIIEEMGKETYIVINDKIEEIEGSVLSILDDVGDLFKIIKKSKYDKLVDENSLLILTDTNKKSLIPIKKLTTPREIFILDHHNLDWDTVETENVFIDSRSSSTSELIFDLSKLINFKNFGLKKADGTYLNLATYLLSGVYLDTSYFDRKLSRKTQNCIAELLMMYGDLSYVNKLFQITYKEDMMIQQLVSQTKWVVPNCGIICNFQKENEVYRKEVLAIASDRLLRYKSTELSIVFGFIGEGLVHISGRSRGNIHVGDIMSLFGGGGHESSGAAQVNVESLDDIYEYLVTIIKKSYYKCDFIEYQKKKELIFKEELEQNVVDES